MSGGIQAAPNNQYQFAIYSDNGSDEPGNYVASSAIGTLGTAPAWYTLPITATLTANTTYWLVYWQNGTVGSDDGYSYTAPVNGALNDGGTYTWQGGSDNGMPATFPAIEASGPGVASLYASYASSSPALTINPYGDLTQSGSALFQDPTDSTQAFQVANSLGSALLTADTADMAIVIDGNLEVNGHFITGGNTPTIAAGSAACSSPTVNVSGNDTSGTITITTGTGCSGSGTLATISFANAFGASPHVALTPGGANSLGLGAYSNDGTVSTTGFTIGTDNTPANSTTYQWNYWVTQ